MSVLYIETTLQGEVNLLADTDSYVLFWPESSYLTSKLVRYTLALNTGSNE